MFFDRITQRARQGAAYGATLSELAALELRTEARVQSQAWGRRAIALAVLAFALIWIQLGLFAWVWDSPYRRWLPFVIGAGLALVALLVWQTARLSTQRRMFERTRRALAADLHWMGVDAVSATAQRQARAMPEPQRRLTIEQANAEADALAADLDEMRRSLWEPASGAATGSEAGPSAPFAANESHGFQPKSRTMQLLLGFGDREVASMVQAPLKAAAVLLGARLLRKMRLRTLISLWPLLRFGLRLARTQAVVRYRRSPVHDPVRGIDRARIDEGSRGRRGGRPTRANPNANR